VRALNHRGSITLACPGSAGHEHPPSVGDVPTDQGRRPRQAHAERDLWPRDFGRDGVSGLVTLDRAMRSRDAARPTMADELEAAEVVDSLLARIDGRRPRAYADR